MPAQLQPGEKKDDSVLAQYSSLGPAYEVLSNERNDPQTLDESPTYALAYGGPNKVTDEPDHVYAVLERP